MAYKKGEPPPIPTTLSLPAVQSQHDVIIPRIRSTLKQRPSAVRPAKTAIRGEFRRNQWLYVRDYARSRAGMYEFSKNQGVTSKFQRARRVTKKYVPH